MSATSTPLRPRPALVIPRIENKSQFDGNSSLMSCHGLPTPPQSALESRRPSLQFSSMPEYPPSAGATFGSFSQPSTPVRGLDRHDEAYDDAWTEHAAMATNTPSHLSHTTSGVHVSQSLLHTAFQAQHAYHPSDIEYMDTYADASASSASAFFGPPQDVSCQSTWSSPHHVEQSFATEVSSGLGPTLFAMSHVMGSENTSHDPLGVQHASMYNHHSFSHTVGSFHGYSAAESNIYAQPQVVVPSQLSPQDDFSQHYHALESPHHVGGGYSTSLSSYTGTLGDFEMVRPPSPTSQYFAQSDEDDFVPVNFKRIESPSHDASLRRSGGSRSRRRGARRVRNNTASYTHRHYTGNTEVVCENFNPIDGPPVSVGSHSKKFRCAHVQGNGAECGVSFDRSEHLKRHALKHTDERKYPCPLPDCSKRIQRPDNAADHFKTHLRPTKPGKRNHHFEWIFVRRAISRAYEDEKRANKLLDNLQKWIDAGMPESASQRRGSHLVR